MPYTIDVSGLSPEAVRAMESLVRMLKAAPAKEAAAPSIFDLFGKAPVLRTGDEIAKQVQEERDAWGEP